MIALLDTHTFAWAVTQPQKVSIAAATIISDPNVEVLVSAASAWEISTKVRLGKWEEARRLERNFLQAVELAGYKLLALTVQDALRAGRFTNKHKDPMDRMLAAQALTLDCPLLSSDRKLDVFGVNRIW